MGRTWAPNTTTQERAQPQPAARPKPDHVDLADLADEPRSSGQRRAFLGRLVLFPLSSKSLLGFLDQLLLKCPRMLPELRCPGPPASRTFTSRENNVRSALSKEKPPLDVRFSPRPIRAASPRPALARQLGRGCVASAFGKGAVPCPWPFPSISVLPTSGNKSGQASAGPRQGPARFSLWGTGDAGLAHDACRKNPISRQQAATSCHRPALCTCRVQAFSKVQQQGRSHMHSCTRHFGDYGSVDYRIEHWGIEVCSSDAADSPFALLLLSFGFCLLVLQWNSRQ